MKAVTRARQSGDQQVTTLRAGGARFWPRPAIGECERFYRKHGIAIERVLTDNGKCFRRPGRTDAPSAGSNRNAHGPTDHRRTARSVYQDRGAVRSDGEAARSRRSDSGKRHVEEALWSLLPLTFARFVDRRAPGGPAKVT